MENTADDSNDFVTAAKIVKTTQSPVPRIFDTFLQLTILDETVKECVNLMFKTRIIKISHVILLRHFIKPVINDLQDSTLSGPMNDLTVH